MILKVCDSLPVLAMKIKDKQIGKGKETLKFKSNRREVDSL